MNEAVQDKDSSWNRVSEWGQLSRQRILDMAQVIRAIAFEDDTAADFGGNDGFCAQAFHAETHIPMLVVDGLESRLEVARKHGLKTLHTELESIPLPDQSIDWGFCSHTLEHVEDLEATLRELRRLIRRMLWVVVPLEKDEEWQKNPAHRRGSPNPRWWRDRLEEAGFLVTASYQDNLNKHDIIIVCANPGAL